MFKFFADPKAIAHYVSDLLIEQLQKKDNTVLGLATGSTMVPVYDVLSTQILAQQIDVSNATTFNLDEYLGLSSEHPQSANTRLACCMLSKRCRCTHCSLSVRIKRSIIPFC